MGVPKISIIVPVHNAGNAIRKCLDSILNQTLKEIEVVLVLDCPTDGTDIIVKEYAKNDDRIVVIENEKNLHIGLSRNVGIENAKGEYIGFSDHDDYRLLTMYEELYAAAKKDDADIVMSGFGIDIDNVKKEILYPEIAKKDIKETILKLLIGTEKDSEKWNFFSQNGGMWNKIYRRSSINKHHIRFVDNRECTYEDLIFLIQSFYFVDKISIVNKVFYYHLEEINNTSGNYFYNSYPLVGNYLNEVYQFLIANKILDQYKINYYNSVINSVIVSLMNEIKRNKSNKNKISAFLYFKKFPFVKQAFKNNSVNSIFNRDRSFTTKLLRSIIAVFYKI